MALSLTCVCGARFELEDTLAGQKVLCPECQQSLQAPSLAQTPRRTSVLALASVVLALVGAFTIIGTAAATLLGLAALVAIARHRQQLAGAGLAIFGIITGVVFTALTVFAVWTGDLFGLGGRINEGRFKDQVDFSGPLEIIRPDRGFAITRPSNRWGQAFSGTVDDPLQQPLANHPDLLLVQVSQGALVDVRREGVDHQNMEAFQSDVLKDLSPPNQGGVRRRDFLGISQMDLQSSRDLPWRNGVETRELSVNVACSGQRWKFLIRLIRAPGQRWYVVRAYAPAARFRSNLDELHQILDSFRPVGVR